MQILNTWLNNVANFMEKSVYASIIAVMVAVDHATIRATPSFSLRGVD
jgi:hypothetical protein